MFEEDHKKSYIKALNNVQDIIFFFLKDPSSQRHIPNTQDAKYDFSVFNNSC